MEQGVTDKYAVVRHSFPTGGYCYQVLANDVPVATVGSTLEAAACIDQHMGWRELRLQPAELALLLRS